MTKYLAALLLCACSSIEPREAYTQWVDGPCPDGGPQVELVRFVSSPTPVLDCIAAAPPASKGIMVGLLVLGWPVMACAYNKTVYVNTNLGKLSEDMVEHEMAHLYGMSHPSLLPLYQSCVYTKP